MPTIALGIPGNIAAALLIGALTMHGIVPGPFMLQQHSDLIYALFASMILANGIHLLIGRIGLNLWVKLARVPRSLILPPVLVLCITGIYLANQSMWDIGTMFVFAGLGLVFNRAGFPVVGLVIGFLLGDMFETSLRQALLLYHTGGPAILLSPVAAAFLLLTVVVLARAVWRQRTVRTA